MPTQILVYGPRKSGSTLLQRLLDSDSLFTHPSETKIKYFDQLSSQEISKLDPKAIQLMFQTGDEGHALGIDNDKYWAFLDRSGASLASVRDYILSHVNAVMMHSSALAETISKPDSISANSSFIIKEVGGDPSTIIPQFLEAFPGGKVIQIMRDPPWVASAIFRDRRISRKLILSWPEKTRQARKAWETYLGQLNFISHPSVVTVRYEKLVRSPDTVRDAAIKAGLPEDNDYATPTMNGRQTEVRTASRRSTKIFTKDAGWQKDLTPSEILAIYLARMRFIRYRYKAG